eukprot:TRINITY_DN5712_c0_g1_i1.p1 TRINITY_DN5712_c0_g1~~TRINITY_DN5712_c0_g1_i1.p1  ORF type:complete len:541 (-),score=86.75 TRINITY_DN5712_c0_g1_i1:203-1825(-)
MEETEVEQFYQTLEQTLDSGIYTDFHRLVDIVKHVEGFFDFLHNGETFLTRACNMENRKQIHVLLAQNISIDAKNERGCTPLMVAALTGNLAIVNDLLENNANIDQTNDEGWTVAHLMASTGRLEVLARLFRHSPDCLSKVVYAPGNMRNDGLTCLHLACRKDHIHTIKWLCGQSTVDINAKTTNGDTPLIEAIRASNFKTVEYFHESAFLSSSFKIKNKMNETSLMIAEKIVNSCNSADIFILEDAKNIFKLLSARDSFLPTWLASIFVLSFERHIWPTFLFPIMWFGAIFLHYMFVVDGDYTFTTSVFNVLSFIAGVFFLICIFADPGSIIDRKTGKLKKKKFSDNQLREKYNKGLHGEGSHSLCVPCRISKPLRSKHCQYTNNCIERYDHYCPWIHQSVGAGNHIYFIIFLLSAELMGSWFLITSVTSVLWSNPFHLIGLFKVLSYLFGSICVFYGGALLYYQVSLISKNMTTNEMHNWERYEYLQCDYSGKFENPFDQGTWYLNWKDFLLNDQNDDEIKEKLLKRGKKSSDIGLMI